MITQAPFERPNLGKRLSEALGLLDALSGCFNALAENQLGSQHLSVLAQRTMDIQGLSTTLPIAEILAAIEPAHTGMIVAEAGLLVTSAEVAQHRARLLLRSSREIHCGANASDAVYAEKVDDIQAEILSLQPGYSGYALKTSSKFLVAAASYPSVGTFVPDMMAIQDRHIKAGWQSARLDQAMLDSPMAPDALATFYAPYDDMTDRPRDDYASNTRRMAHLHLELADTTMARLGLRLTQAYLCMRDPLIMQAINGDDVLRKDFQTKFTETGGALTRAHIHLNSGNTEHGYVNGAAHYINLRRTYRP